VTAVKQRHISTLLVANRGEIALRIMRSARELGMRTVAVYSQADQRAPHVGFADEAVCIGPPPVAQSYLQVDAIIAAARQTGAQAIHPGYGLLSENAQFARAVVDAGLIFVGPGVEAITVMGDKAVSKRRMQQTAVPCIPGYEGEDQDESTLLTAADRIGFPLMVKAAAGGGGRGMRLVESSDLLADALKLARSEAENAFGSSDLILEKAIVAPRHVEIQIFADGQGNVIHLGERDCSVQRRHQKVIEEAPCPVMTAELRAKMGAAAVEAARAVDYCGAGTVEFLLDADGRFYFLEMNTRLQVEHPVTELVTGLDLVAMQLQVAQGQPLELTQEDVTLQGHAIEVRLYAEDPEQGFLPSTGPVLLWQPPVAAGVRVDAGIATGGEVSPYYDSMVAKIIGYGRNREQARSRLLRGLAATALFGMSCNRDFLLDALMRPQFASGSATTSFIAETYGDAGFVLPEPDAPLLAIAAAVQLRLAQRAALARAPGVSTELLDWSSSADLETISQYMIADSVTTLRTHPLGGGLYQVAVDSERISVAVESMSDQIAELVVEGRRQTVQFCAPECNTLWIATAERLCRFVDLSAGGGEDEEGGGGVCRAPMHGLLLELKVAVGERVAKGDRLAVLEAMKMQHAILAEIDGTVTEVAAAAGTQLAADDLILNIESDAD